jgi:hypothetical protein
MSARLKEIDNEKKAKSKQKDTMQMVQRLAKKAIAKRK